MYARLNPRVVNVEGESMRRWWWWMLGEMKEMGTTVLKGEVG
jgi:hypothetical protein